MVSKIKELVNSLYAAPLTQPFKNVAAFALYPLKDIIARFKGTYEPIDATTGEALGGISGLIGAVAGMLFLGGHAGGTAFGAFAASNVVLKTIAITSAAMAGGAAGLVGGAIGGLATASALAGIAGLTFGFVPGIFQGLSKAYKHHQSLKSPIAPPKMQFPPKPHPPWPAPPLPPPSNPSGLPKKNMIEQLAEKSPEERQKLLEKMREQFADDFSTIIQKQADKAVTLSDPRKLKIGKPLQYPVKKQTP